MSCVEEPDLPYEDGASTIFLYTKGEVGNPPEELRQLACYMEHSVAENAQTVGLIKLHEMVTKVKNDRKVGLAYMKAYEIEKRIREKAQAEGIRIFIVDNLEEQVPEDRILAKLQKHYHLTEEAAKAHYDKVVSEEKELF